MFSLISSPLRAKNREREHPDEPMGRTVRVVRARREVTPWLDPKRRGRAAGRTQSILRWGGLLLTLLAAAQVWLGRDDAWFVAVGLVVGALHLVGVVFGRRWTWPSHVPVALAHLLLVPIAVAMGGDVPWWIARGILLGPFLYYALDAAAADAVLRLPAMPPVPAGEMPRLERLRYPRIRVQLVFIGLVIWALELFACVLLVDRYL